jgi:hypothetical protein
MIEKSIYDYLSAYFADENIPVYLVLPESLPNPSEAGEFILIEKVGSSLENWLFDSTIAIQSYGKDLFSAASLSQRVIRAMLEAVSIEEVTSIDLNSEYEFTDTETKRPRYQAVFDVSHYYKDE